MLLPLEKIALSVLILASRALEVEISAHFNLNVQNLPLKILQWLASQILFIFFNINNYLKLFLSIAVNFL